ncbi:MAG TPA: hypothetical protein VIG36_14845 [Methylocystis sp.]
MSDTTNIHIGMTAEEVALKLLHAIAAHEDVPIGTGASKGKADRKWLLDTHSEFLEAARGYRAKPKKWPAEAN